MPPFVPRKRRRSYSSDGEQPPAPQKRPPTTELRKRPTLFDAVDAIDATRSGGQRLEANQAFLAHLAVESSDSSLTDISDSGFEDVKPAGRSRGRKPDGAGSAEDEVDWEDAMAVDPTRPLAVAPEPSGDLELTLGESSHVSALKMHGKKGPSKVERQIRVQTHCLHVQYLLFHNLIRNGWACDREVQTSLVAQMPPKMLKEVERWKTALGITDSRSSLAPQNAKAERAGRKGARSARAGRDWGSDAEKLEPGVPNLSRGDPLLKFLRMLSAYWKKRFKIVEPGLRKQGYKSLPDLEAEILSWQDDPHDPTVHGEKIRDLHHFRQRAKAGQGSRDVGAQLFTALLRGLGLEARMVASLQPVGFGWSKVEEATVKSTKENRADDNTIAVGPVDATEEKERTGSCSEADDDRLSSRRQHVPKSPNQDVRTRKTLPKRGWHSAEGLDSVSEEMAEVTHSEDSSVVELKPTPRIPHSQSMDKDLPFPIYWTEVLSPITNQYIAVESIVLNVVASTPETLAAFEPRGAKAEKSKQVIAYVVGYSADGTAKDVTVRYLRRRITPGKTKGMRMPVEKVPIYNQRGKVKGYEDYDWFKTVMSGYARDGRLRTAVDDLEDEQDLKPLPAATQKKAGAETLQGYKSSVEFVLERFLRREEALRPGSKHVRIFTSGKGDKAVEEKVYRREDVLACKTVESWHKDGREVRLGEQPVKMVPMRAVTLTRKREIQQAEAEGGEKVMQGLYSIEQTDWIIPPPITGGVIPKNAFGNMDCYVPSMVPQGAVHLPYRGMAKVCRRLQISHAEAVTGFEFKSQRAVPVVQGVVVAVENGQVVLDAWREDEAERVRKEDVKRQTVALGMWRKFLMGLRIYARVKDDYGADATLPDEANPFTNQSKKRRPSQADDLRLRTDGAHPSHDDDDDELAGGFLHDSADDGHLAGGGFMPPSRPTEVTDDADLMVENTETGLRRRRRRDPSAVSSPMDEASTSDEDRKADRADDVDLAPRVVQRKAAAERTDATVRTTRARGVSGTRPRRQNPREKLARPGPPATRSASASSASASDRSSADSDYDTPPPAAKRGLGPTPARARARAAGRKPGGTVVGRGVKSRFFARDDGGGGGGGGRAVDASGGSLGTSLRRSARTRTVSKQT